MDEIPSLSRKTHLLGTKIRNLRKRHHLTMKDLSVRCVQIDSEAAPSVSYISMIENGKRSPSEATLHVLAEVFQKEVSWFFDHANQPEAPAPAKKESGGISGIALEPGFLFSKEHLQIALPELLLQTGTTGRQFAHLLIRAHQEHNRNRFPDLERAAEEVGKKRFPISLEDVIDICKRLGLVIKWFDRPTDDVVDETGMQVKTAVRSFFEEPNVIYVNSIMRNHPDRLKYDLATHIGNRVLHSPTGSVTLNAAGHGLLEDVREDTYDSARSMSIDSQEILRAWQNFECSFFAGALLCPKVPFRQHLDRQAYSCSSAGDIGVSRSIMMRRMTSVARYPDWHYFDAYPPGKLKAIYRGNGIPLPLGSMRLTEDACQHWGIFRLLTTGANGPRSQISVMRVGNRHHIYASESVGVKDLAGNRHILCAGVDLNPALDNQGLDSAEIAGTLADVCARNGGVAPVPVGLKRPLRSVAKILNIGWIDTGIEAPTVLTCQRSSTCPRTPSCGGFERARSSPVDINRIRRQIVEETQ